MDTPRTIQLYFIEVIRSHQTIEYKEDRVLERSPIKQSLEVVEFIRNFEQGINLKESSIWNKKSHDHILEEEKILGGS